MIWTWFPAQMKESSERDEGSFCELDSLLSEIVRSSGKTATLRVTPRYDQALLRHAVRHVAYPTLGRRSTFFVVIVSFVGGSFGGGQSPV